MSKKASSNQTKTRQGSSAQDPSHDLLKSLMDEINMTSKDLEQLTGLTGEFNSSDSTNATSVPDGLNLQQKPDELTKSMLMPGLAKGSSTEEPEQNLSILLDQNFNDSTQASGVRSLNLTPDLSKNNTKPFVSEPTQYRPSGSIPDAPSLEHVLSENTQALSLAIPESNLSELAQLVQQEGVGGRNKPVDLMPPVPKDQDEIVLATEVIPSAESIVNSLRNEIGKGLTDFRNQVEENLPLTGFSNFSDKTVALAAEPSLFAREGNSELNLGVGVGEKTVAVAGFSDRKPEKLDEKVKVSIGEVRSSSPLSSWSKVEGSLGVAQNLELAQEKILQLERENQKLRQQNDELSAAAEVIKERADLLANELSLLKSDRDSLDQSFKNEIMIMRNQMSRKDAEIERVKAKADELESMLRFDMKKIRVRERELENRLELLRSEKNALVKTKDEMILDLRRKCDQFQMETESFRQKCVELNKALEMGQESVKRTTRALRLAMANLEVQEEKKQTLKKAE